MHEFEKFWSGIEEHLEIQAEEVYHSHLLSACGRANVTLPNESGTDATWSAGNVPDASLPGGRVLFFGQAALGVGRFLLEWGSSTRNIAKVQMGCKFLRWAGALGRLALEAQLTSSSSARAMWLIGSACSVYCASLHSSSHIVRDHLQTSITDVLFNSVQQVSALRTLVASVVPLNADTPLSVDGVWAMLWLGSALIHTVEVRVWSRRLQNSRCDPSLIEECEEYLQEAHRMLGQCGTLYPTPLLAHFAHTCGEAERYSGNLEKSLWWHQQSLSMHALIAPTLGRSKALAEVSLGFLLHEMGKGMCQVVTTNISLTHIPIF